MEGTQTLPTAERVDETHRSYVNWRKALEASGVTVDEMRERIDVYVHTLSPARQKSAVAMADRVMRWYREGLTTAEAARQENMGSPRMSHNIQTIARIALNPALDSVEYILGDGGQLSSDEKVVDAIEGAKTRRHNWRAEIQASGLSIETMRARLNTYLARVHGNRNFKQVVTSTLRYMRWFESGSSASDAAKKEQISDAGMTQLIQRLSHVVLDPAYDPEGVVFDWMAEEGGEMPRPAVSLTDSAERKGEQKPVNMGAAKRGGYKPRPSQPSSGTPAFRPSIPSDWFVDPDNLVDRRNQRSQDYDQDDNPLAWQTDALCAQTDPDAFFPEKGGSTRDAKKICKNCEVKIQCLEYAVANDERFGIWGGLSERERRRLRRARYSV